MISASVKARTCDVIKLGLLPLLGPEKQTKLSYKLISFKKKKNRYHTCQNIDVDTDSQTQRHWKWSLNDQRVGMIFQ